MPYRQICEEVCHWSESPISSHSCRWQVLAFNLITFSKSGWPIMCNLCDVHCAISETHFVFWDVTQWFCLSKYRRYTGATLLKWASIASPLTKYSFKSIHRFYDGHACSSWKHGQSKYKLKKNWGSIISWAAVDFATTTIAIAEMWPKRIKTKNLLWSRPMIGFKPRGIPGSFINLLIQVLLGCTTTVTFYCGPSVTSSCCCSA